MQEFATPKLKEMLADKNLFKPRLASELGCAVMPAEMKEVYTRIIQSSEAIYELEKETLSIRHGSTTGISMSSLRTKPREWLKSPNKRR